MDRAAFCSLCHCAQLQGKEICMRVVQVYLSRRVEIVRFIIYPHKVESSFSLYSVRQADIWFVTSFSRGTVTIHCVYIRGTVTIHCVYYTRGTILIQHLCTRDSKGVVMTTIPFMKSLSIYNAWLLVCFNTFTDLIAMTMYFILFICFVLMS